MLPRLRILKTIIDIFIFIALIIVGWELSNYLVYDLLDIQEWLAIMILIISLPIAAMISFSIVMWLTVTSITVSIASIVDGILIFLAHLLGFTGEVVSAKDAENSNGIKKIIEKEKTQRIIAIIRSSIATLSSALMAWVLSNYLAYDLLDIQEWLAIIILIISLIIIFAISYFLLSLLLVGFFGVSTALIIMLLSDLEEKKTWKEVFFFFILYIGVQISLNIIFRSENIFSLIMQIIYPLIVTYCILKAKNRLKDLKVSIPSFLLAPILGILFIPFLTRLNPVRKQLNAQDKALLDAVKSNNISAVKTLLDAGADIEAKSDDGVIALQWASIKGHADMVKLLIKAGASVDAKGNHGDTVLYMASWRGHADIVKLLIDAGADIEAKTAKGATALHMAIHKGNTDIVKLLIDAGFDIHAKDKNGDTALHYASQEGHADMIKLLIDAGAKE